MEKVYVVLNHRENRDDTILGIFTDMEKVKEYISELNKVNFKGHLFVTEHTLDEGFIIGKI